MLRRNVRRALLILVLVAAGWLAVQHAEAAEAPYRLNPGDVVRISVWREEELNRQASIQPDGSLSFPLVGQVAAAGRTPAEVQADIQKRVSRYVPEAVVTVELIDARGNKIFVLGEVNRPGEYQLGRPITVVQAISLAGGFTPYARRSKIRVLRAGDPPQEMPTVDYDEVAEGSRLETNLRLEAGDTVIVPGGSLF